MLGCDLFIWPTILANLFGLFISKAALKPTPMIRIHHVIEMRPPPEMRRIAAERIIAGMKGLHAFGARAAVEYQGDMRGDIIFAAEAKFTVAFMVLRFPINGGCPFPAIILASGQAGDIRPKTGACSIVDLHGFSYSRGGVGTR